MNEAKERIARSLREAHACELTLAQALQTQIDAAPRGNYRKGLQKHLQETQDHARRVEQRLSELGQQDNPVLFGIRLIENALGPFFAVAKTPLGLLEASRGPERVLDDARDACATEAAQIARYAAIQRLAESSGDRETATLAASIRGDEQKLLNHVLDAIPSLTSWALDAKLSGKAAAAIRENGTAAAARSKGTPRRRATTPARPAAKNRPTSSIPGPPVLREPRSPAVRAAAEQAERSETTTAPPSDLPIADYHTLTVDGIMPKLHALSSMDLARVDIYEREHLNRPLVLTRIASLRAAQLAPAYRTTGSRAINAARISGGDDQMPPRPRFGEMPEDDEGATDATPKLLAST